MKNINIVYKKIFAFLKKHNKVVIGLFIVAVAAVILSNMRIETVSQHQNRLASEAEQRRQLMDHVNDNETNVVSSDTSESNHKNNPGLVDQLEGVTESDGLDKEVAGEQETGSDSSESQENDQNQSDDTENADNSGKTGTDGSIAAGENNETAGSGSTGSTEYTGSREDTDSTGGSGISELPATGTNQGQQNQQGQSGQNEANQGQSDKDNNALIIVTVRITCNKVVNNPELNTSAAIPANGVMLETQLPVKNGTNVYEALQAACQDNGINYVNNGTAKSAYIVSIGGLSEKECGRFSGWKYKVNDEIGSVACSSYKLNNGDVIEWYFATNYTD